MKLKSYFAGTVEAAVEQARQELGPEAMLVDSRKAAPDAKHLGHYEVVFASLPSWEASGELPAHNGSAGYRNGRSFGNGTPAGSTDPNHLLRQEFAKLQQEIEAMRRTIWRSTLNPAGRLPPFARVAEALSLLVEAEVDPQLAQEIATCLEARFTGDPLLPQPPKDRRSAVLCSEGHRAEDALVAELESRFSVDPTLGRQNHSSHIVALVGPPGCGKTTTLVKLAVNCGLRGRRSVQILSVDTNRVAAAEQLRSYAAILGVGFQVLDTTRSLEQALEAHQHKDLIFIDTPGYSSADIDNAADLAPFLSSHLEIETHLVLAASTKSADLTHAVDRFEIFRPSKLLFTKVDETGTFGPVFSEAVRTGKPISFLTTGQQIPEDLEAATKDHIVDRLTHGRSIKVLSAA
jgi:flagellar biosynthesis protein FlhF